MSRMSELQDCLNETAAHFTDAHDAMADAFDEFVEVQNQVLDLMEANE